MTDINHYDTQEDNCHFCYEWSLSTEMGIFLHQTLISLTYLSYIFNSDFLNIIKTTPLKVCYVMYNKCIKNEQP